MHIFKTTEELTLDDKCEEYVIESLRRLAEAVSRRATTELEELVEVSPSLRLDDSVKVRLVKAKDNHCRTASGYRDDPSHQVVDVEPVCRNFTRDISPPVSLYCKIDQNLNSDLTSSRRVHQRKRARDDHSEADSTIEKVFADELAVSYARISAIVKKMPYVGTVLKDGKSAVDFEEIKSSLGMKIREYNHSVGDVTASLSVFFKDNLSMLAGLEGPQIDHTPVATSLLDLARGKPPNESMMCKSVLARPLSATSNLGVICD